MVVEIWQLKLCYDILATLEVFVFDVLFELILREDNAYTHTLCFMRADFEGQL